MKSLASMPFLQTLKYTKDNYQPEIPALIEEEPPEPLSPMEIRRFIRALRENRRFAFMDELYFTN